jgi:S1-C subfamily serine protease
VVSNTASHMVSEIIRHGRVRRSFIGLDGQRVTGADDLLRLLGSSRIGGPTRLAVVADARLRQFSVVPAERPPG